MTRKSKLNHLNGKSSTSVIRSSGHYCMAWFCTAADMNEWACIHLHSPAILYRGRRDRLPHKVAEQVGTVHARYQKYYQECLMVLWKILGTRHQGGSENPVLAINMDIPAQYKFIVVWRAIGLVLDGKESDETEK